MLKQILPGLLLLLSLMTAAARAEVPAIGSAAPGFSLRDQNGTLRSLSDWRGKWLVLYFYPKDDTPGCTEEACSFRDDWLQLSGLGAQVVDINTIERICNQRIVARETRHKWTSKVEAAEDNRFAVAA